ncbi:MAG TPA: DUF1015 domain-containing protein [Actinomycetes bacterium]|jgi:uncharacterized protein (DUF1015 family)|nr:DUF1015 domain-containing protein [Actinomycetes bacterium]
MVAAGPFQGLRFDPAVVGDPALVIAPPYDVISPEARDAYEAMSPYNMVRLILARGGDGEAADYQQVAKLLVAWHDEGALLLDPAPALYLYEERYTLRGRRRVQRGVLASVDLDATATWVLPHERTMAAPVADRLRLLEATGVNLSPVFGVYAGGGRAAAVLDEVTAEPPAIDAADETGVVHRLWPVADPERVAAWRALLAGQRVLIADGHHRYRTSLAYQAAMRAASGGRHGPWDQLLMFLVDHDQHGPSVEAIHRLLADLPAAAVLATLAGDFEVRPAAGPADAEEALRRLPAEQLGFGLYGGGESALLVARDPAGLAAETRLGRPPLDVEVLHGPVLAGRLGVADFEHAVAYESDLAEAVRRVDLGTHASLLLVRPAPFPAVAAVAEAGGTLPQKTTYFYPKPRDGLVLRPLDPAAFAPHQPEAGGPS